MPGAHAMDNDAVILRGKLSGISLKINEQITAIHLAHLELKDAAADLFALKVGDDKVISATGILENRVVEDLKRSAAQLLSIRQEIETYMGKI